MTENHAPRVSSTNGVLEVESKFSAGPDVVVPTFDFIPGVSSTTTEVRELSAMYLDTADLRLTRAKHTLRRRTGGPDEGWHLKSPASRGRMEYQAALADGAVEGEGENATYTVPADLLAPVRSIVRNYPLAPIARVDNSRHVTNLFDASGTPIAEFCDDHVTAVSFLDGGETTTWREWEIELIGDYAENEAGAEIMARISQVLQVAGAVPSESPSKLRTALGDSMANAPVPPTPADLPEGTPGRAVVDALAANVEKLVEVDPQVRRDEWDSVHQMRVATRELRSHMQTFHGIVVGEQIGQMEKELKELASVLGVARDAEVVAERFENQLQRPEAEVIQGELREHLVDDIRKDYHKAHRHVVFALNSDRYLNLLDSLEKLLADPPIQIENHVEEDEAGSADDAAGAAGTASSAAASEAETAEEAGIEEAAAQAAPAADDAEAVGEADTEQEVTGQEATDAVESVPATVAPQRELTPEEIREETNAVLAQHLRSTFKKFVKRHNLAVAGRADSELSGAERDDRFHDVRKAAKKVRYSAEAAQAAGLPTKKLYAACKTLQSSLGDFQDTCTARDMLLAKAARAHATGKDTFGYGVLYQIEHYDGLKALDHYDDDVDDVLEAFEKMERKMAKSAKKRKK